MEAVKPAEGSNVAVAATLNKKKVEGEAKIAEQLISAATSKPTLAIA